MDNFFSARLVIARKHRGLTQKAAAGLLGITPVTLNIYEKGRRTPGKDTLLQMATVYGVNPGWLLSGEGDMLSNHVAEGYAIYAHRESLPEPLKKIVKLLEDNPDKQWETYAKLLEELEETMRVKK